LPKEQKKPVASSTVARNKKQFYGDPKEVSKRRASIEKKGRSLIRRAIIEKKRT